MSETIIRPAEPCDVPAVLRLQNDLFPGDPNALDEPAALETVEFRKKMLFVAGFEGQVVGFTLLKNRGVRPWTGIDFVGVAPAFAGLGIGRQLTAFSLFHVPRPIARLFVRPSNAPARALYKRLGFRQSSIRVGSYEDGEDALVLMKWLGPRFLRSPLPPD